MQRSKHPSENEIEYVIYAQYSSPQLDNFWTMGAEIHAMNVEKSSLQNITKS